MIGTIRWMAPEICTPPPEQSSFESDVWSYGCIILETTSGREPWIDQFIDDPSLFRALQNKENAPLFARICANQSGPSHICKLLVQCCTWSKVNRPRFVEICNRLQSEHDEDMSNDETHDRMSTNASISNDSLNSDDKETKYYDALDFNEHENSRSQSTREEVNDNFNTKILSKSNKSQGRLTGEIYTSRGSASGRPIYEGIRGGRYYLTDNGTKIYLHK